MILNLSTIETLFPEKRTFFLEGSELFQVVSLQLFYSCSVSALLRAPSDDVLQVKLAWMFR